MDGVWGGGGGGLFKFLVDICRLGERRVWKVHYLGKYPRVGTYLPGYLGRYIDYVNRSDLNVLAVLVMASSTGNLSMLEAP